MKKAIAYTKEMLRSESGEVITRQVQEERMKRFAAENGIEIVGWYADDAGESGIMKRPGVQALLARVQPDELVLCERAWALSRSMTDLEIFLEALDRRGSGFECATLLWDRVSQQCRRRSRSLPVLPGAKVIPGTAGQARRYHVTKPVRLNFVQLVH